MDTKEKHSNFGLIMDIENKICLKIRKKGQSERKKNDAHSLEREKRVISLNTQSHV